MAVKALIKTRISIHAPREGSDSIMQRLLQAKAISIHAPREGSDQYAQHQCTNQGDFNPRSP